MENIDIVQSRALAQRIEAATGFVTVTFVKKDGTVRKLNGRGGVKKHLKGGVRTTSPDQYVILYEPATESYKNINRDTIIEVTGV